MMRAELRKMEETSYDDGTYRVAAIYLICVEVRKLDLVPYYFAMIIGIVPDVFLGQGAGEHDVLLQVSE